VSIQCEFEKLVYVSITLLTAVTEMTLSFSVVPRSVGIEDSSTLNRDNNFSPSTRKRDKSTMYSSTYPPCSTRFSSRIFACATHFSHTLLRSCSVKMNVSAAVRNFVRTLSAHRTRGHSFDNNSTNHVEPIHSFALGFVGKHHHNCCPALSIIHQASPCWIRIGPGVKAAS